MAIKTKISTPRTSEKSRFPVLMIAPQNDHVILATRRNGLMLEGTTLHSGTTNNAVGGFSGGWDSDAFLPFEGSITLENE